MLSVVIFYGEKSLSVVSYLLILVCCITVSFDNCIAQMIVAHFVLGTVFRFWPSKAIHFKIRHSSAAFQDPFLGHIESF